MKIALVGLAVLIARGAVASPTTGEAKVAFDRGVAAYTKGDYAAASEALEKSFRLDPDQDTLFAWAQSERKQSRCDKAIRLYERLLKFDMPDANRQAVQTNLDECKVIVGPAKVEGTTTTHVDEVKHDDRVEHPPIQRDEPRPWWRDPIGDTFVGVGAVGLGVGVAYLIGAHGTDAQANDKSRTTNYFEYQTLEDKAKSQSRNGTIALGAGAALVGVGIVWYATHRGGGGDTRVSGWLDPGGGGVAVTGGF